MLYKKARQYLIWNSLLKWLRLRIFFVWFNPVLFKPQVSHLLRISNHRSALTHCTTRLDPLHPASSQFLLSLSRTKSISGNSSFGCTQSPRKVHQSCLCPHSQFNKWSMVNQLSYICSKSEREDSMGSSPQKLWLSDPSRGRGSADHCYLAAHWVCWSASQAYAGRPVESSIIQRVQEAPREA